MARVMDRRSRWFRALGLAAWLSFLGAAPSVGGLELAWHLAHGSPPDHGQAPHVEEAGGATHGDHCQLGPSKPGPGRIAATAPVPVPVAADRCVLPAFALPVAGGLHTLPFQARAPPLIG